MCTLKAYISSKARFYNILGKFEDFLLEDWRGFVKVRHLGFLNVVHYRDIGYLSLRNCFLNVIVCD